MNNIKRLRKEKNLSLKELGALCDISESAMQRIEAGTRRPSFEVLLKLTDALGKTSDEIMGLSEIAPTITDDFVTFPIIGDVAAGYDHIATEDWTAGSVDIPASFLRGRQSNEFFVLRVQGDSMFPTYQHGDLVLVLKQSTMNYSGQIGVVIYDDNLASIKRVEFVMGEDWMRLVPVNPSYPPITVRDEALEHCRVLGIPRLLIRSIE